MRARDRAYAALREAIVDGDLPPGAALGEVEQAARLGVSRTPVREALTRLVADGLATSVSPRVLIVSGLDADRIRDLYELREALESRAAALAARRRRPEPFAALRDRFASASRALDGDATDVERVYALIGDLDAAIDDAVGNADLRQALAAVRLHSARIRRLARHRPERLRAATAEHAVIVEAILDGDAELAAHATHVHLHASLRSALATLEHPAAPAVDLVRPAAAIELAPEPMSAPDARRARPATAPTA